MDRSTSNRVNGDFVPVNGIQMYSFFNFIYRDTNRKSVHVNAVFNRNESSDDRKKHVESKFRLRNIIPCLSIVYRLTQ